MRRLRFLLFGLGVMAAALAARAQTLPLQLDDQNVKIVNEEGRMIMRIDLMAELRKQHPAQASAVTFELKSVVVEAKSRLGGGQIMLKVQGERGSARFVDLRRIETDPAIYDSNEGFQRVELVNFERGLKGAELVVVSGIRLRHLQLVLGGAEELSLNGVYAGFDAAKVAGARESRPVAPATGSQAGTREGQPSDVRPPPIPRPPEVERREPPPPLAEEPPARQTPPRREPPAIERREVSPPGAVVGTPPKPKREEPRVQPARCLQSFCVGQAVYHRRMYWEGVIVRVDARKNQLVVKFGYDESAFEASVSPRDLGFN